MHRKSKGNQQAGKNSCNTNSVIYISNRKRNKDYQTTHGKFTKRCKWSFLKNKMNSISFN